MLYKYMTIWVSLCLFRMVHFFPESKKQIRPKPFGTLPYNSDFVIFMQTMILKRNFLLVFFGMVHQNDQEANINTPLFQLQWKQAKKTRTQLINHFHFPLHLPLFRTYPNSSLSSGWTATIWAIFFFPKG